MEIFTSIPDCWIFESLLSHSNSWLKCKVSSFHCVPWPKQPTLLWPATGWHSSWWQLLKFPSMLFFPLRSNTKPFPTLLWKRSFVTPSNFRLKPELSWSRNTQDFPDASLCCAWFSAVFPESGRGRTWWCSCQSGSLQMLGQVTQWDWKELSLFFDCDTLNETTPSKSTELLIMGKIPSRI